jgi:hypothetical protein
MSFPAWAARTVLAVLALSAVATASKFEAGWHGQASGWLVSNRDSACHAEAGLRYIPRLSVALPPHMDAELSANAFASVRADLPDSVGHDARLKPYRLWARFSTARFEARAGLQKINFGSATLLRPLMWFDRVDPRDPLALTDGVYGLLGRYYFQSNANIWAWGLLGNSLPKGWEIYGSERWVPEPGARVQIPVPRGEVGISGHHRTASVVWGEPPPDTSPAAESRVGLDGKWDVGIGIWFEAMVGKTSSEHVPYPWRRAATVGMDYTLGLGPGLVVTAEHMVVGGAGELSARGTDAHMSALMLGFPFGLLDNLRGIAYYDWSGKGFYGFLGWQRTLDNWTFSVSAFWNPDMVSAAGGGPTAGITGKGVRVDVIFNH